MIMVWEVNYLKKVNKITRQNIYTNTRTHKMAVIPGTDFKKVGTKAGLSFWSTILFV